MDNNADRELTAEEKKSLLGLARRAIERHFERGDLLRTPCDNAFLSVERGAFVTLHEGDELRGCIGYPLPVKPLWTTVVEMAVAAATQDFRFEPLRREELDRIRIEISVLSLPRPVDRPSEVEVGRHGIIVSKGYRKGLLLPQVPVEQGWDRETFLQHGCLKAGLPPDEWRKGARIEVFAAQVFSE
jgi:AmmeMemoRadiSam system protein A